MQTSIRVALVWMDMEAPEALMAVSARESLLGQCMVFRGEEGPSLGGPKDLPPIVGRERERAVPSGATRREGFSLPRGAPSCCTPADCACICKGASRYMRRKHAVKLVFEDRYTNTAILPRWHMVHLERDVWAFVDTPISTLENSRYGAHKLRTSSRYLRII